MNAGLKAVSLDEVQANILLPYARVNCGRLMCVRFDAARPGDAETLAAARAWIADLRRLVTFHAAVRDEIGRSIERGAGPWFNVGLTYAGLQALAFDPFTLKYLPAAFQDGMHARRERLGDGTAAAQPDDSVHAIVLCYAYDDAVEAQARKVGGAAQQWLPLEIDEIMDLECAVDRALDAPLELLPRRAGVRYLPALDQDIYRLSAGEVVGLEYFGFRDGIAQPRIHGVPSDHPAQTDTVPGSVLLGYPSPKQTGKEADAANLEMHAQLALNHLTHGSFLVVRNLIQDVDGFRQDLGAKAARIEGLQATELAEHMMGRRRDGKPLAADGGPTLDQFTYDQDPNGRGCPFHAHARRVNPRDDRAHLRRLMRRGMPTSSYRYKRNQLGLLFLAYNADIESQFEFVQRQWINAGAESHGLSADRDPIASDEAKFRGTDRDGGTFSFVSASNERPYTVTGLHSHVHAGWGEYVLVPSRRTLAELAAEPSAPIEEYERRVAEIDDRELRRDILGRWLDDPETCRRIFAQVRACGGVVRIERDAVVLVGSAELVAQVAHDEDQIYSVSRQGEAMRQTTGAFYLGMDYWTDEYKLDSATSCAVIPGWKRATQLWDAGDAARAEIKAAQDAELLQVRAAVVELCQAFVVLSLTRAGADHQTPDAPERGEIALAELGAFVLAGLTPKLFGVPQPSARGAFALNIPPSGYIFFAFPEASFVEFAEQASKGLSTYLAHLFTERARRQRHTEFPEDQAQNGGRPPAKAHVAHGQQPDIAWQAKLNTTLEQLEQMFREQGRQCTLEDRVRLMAGVISGMLITSYKVFTDGVSEYVKRFDVDTPITIDPGDVARLPFLMMKQNERSMPNIIYRKVLAPAQLGTVTVAVDDFVLASQGSAMAASGEDWFYGDRSPSEGRRPRSPHFCPGYLVANAILETMSTLLFSLPDLRRTARDGEPVVLTYDWAKVAAVLEASAPH